MFINIIKSYRDVIALCDKDLIGKVFEQGDYKLELKESFYKGKEVSEPEAIKLIRAYSNEDATFNIVGKNSIDTALKAGIIKENIIKTVNGIPFALVLL